MGKEMENMDGMISYDEAVAQLEKDRDRAFQQQVRELEERREAGLSPPSWWIAAVEGNYA